MSSLFVNSALLWLLPLAAIPLVLHLLTLHRLRTVELSTFRFLFDSYVQQRRRMQFLEALLAMLRTLFVLLLILMVARPAIENWNQLFGGTSGSGREVILLIDCSASMNASYGGVKAFDTARARARQIIGKLDRDDRVTLIRLTANPEEVFSRFSTDAREIEERIDSLKTTSSRANVFAALLQLFGPDSARRTNPIVYLFTDCQASSWKEVRNQGLERVLPPDLPFHVVNVGPRDPPANVAVVGDAPRKNRAIAGLPFQLQARVVNYSKTQDAQVVLRTRVYAEKDESKLLGEPLTFALKPGETRTSRIEFKPRQPGIYRGSFEISAGDGDGFDEDDHYSFTIKVEPPVRVLLVNGNPTPADPLDNETRYLYTALTSRGDNPAEAEKSGLAAAAKEIQQSLDVREIAEAALTAEALHDASVVVLANCGAVNANQFEFLRTFVSGGGGLLILPGDKVTQPDLYNTQFFPVPGPQGERLTDATLGPPQGDPDKLETFEQLATLDFGHPALSIFDNPDSDSRHFKTVRMYKRFKIQLPPKKGNAWPLAWFANGDPALVESRLGDGAVILAAFPAHTRWTNLPTKPDFVPLALRLVSHLEHKPDADVSPVVVADGAAQITANVTWDPAEAAVKDPLGNLYTATLERNGARLVVPFEYTSARGYYSVEVRSNRPDQVRAAELAFAVNLPPEESDFALVGEQDLRELLPRVKLTFVDASAQAEQEKGPLGSKIELYKGLIWLVFLIIGAEFLLATTPGRRADGEEEPGIRERLLRASPGAWVGRMTGGGAAGES
jgi:hypothetical protein